MNMFSIQKQVNNIIGASHDAHFTQNITVDEYFEMVNEYCQEIYNLGIMEGKEIAADNLSNLIRR